MATKSRTDKQKHRLLLLKTGDTCCTNPTLKMLSFGNILRNLKNIHTAVRRNLEEILEVKAFLKMSIGFKCRGPKGSVIFYREGSSQKMGDQVLFLRSKRGSKDFFKLKRGITYIF